MRFSQNDKQPKTADWLLSRFQIGRNNGTSCACSLVRFIGSKSLASSSAILEKLQRRAAVHQLIRALHFNLAAILGTEYETLGADNLATELSLPDLNWNGIGRWNWRQITQKLYLGLKWFVPVEQVDFGLATLVLQEIPVELIR